jgi:hypothetical protein
VQQRRLQLPSPPGQFVRPRARGRLERAAPEHARLLELAEALREHALAGPRQSPPQVGEALRAEQQLAHDEQRPPLADQIERTGETAGIVVHPRHGTSLWLLFRTW